MRGAAKLRVGHSAIGLLTALAVGLAAPFTATAPEAAADTTAASSLAGSGTSLVAPLLAAWGQAYQVYFNTQISYATPGDVGGIQALAQRTVDFAVSDSPLTSAGQTACNGCVQVPLTASAVGIGYHVRGVNSKLRLSGPLIAQIYLGKITRWDAPAIKALNPALKLPQQSITPIYARASGDTQTFTDYLSRESPAWRSKVGSGSQVQFPAGISATGGAGITALLERTPGAIAYAGVPYLFAHSLPACAVRNSAGKFVYPNLANIQAAGATVSSVPADNALSIIDPPASAPQAYPLSTFLYAVVAKDSKVKPDLARWIGYAIGHGSSFDEPLDYAPLPAVVLRASEATLKRYSP